MRRSDIMGASWLLCDTMITIHCFSSSYFRPSQQWFPAPFLLARWIQLEHDVPPSVTSGSLGAVIYLHGGGIVAGSRHDAFYPDWLKGSRPYIIHSPL
ncbi:hypothetical protein DAEQUDRAFT_427255 [Daedalea quercina L-15889]|uniref:Uncharacterized protein n=1 Tax=Daedalea quercina L-15889 TaxID=1314783 RepID=A0A165NIR8_9APHY|nr:hypothetical protein DAEQUDRAFT_427255 [Daedalea quercina L-15889]